MRYIKKETYINNLWMSLVNKIDIKVGKFE